MRIEASNRCRQDLITVFYWCQHLYVGNQHLTFMPPGTYHFWFMLSELGHNLWLCIRNMPSGVFHYWFVLSELDHNLWPFVLETCHLGYTGITPEIYWLGQMYLDKWQSKLQNPFFFFFLKFKNSYDWF